MQILRKRGDDIDRNCSHPENLLEWKDCSSINTYRKGSLFYRKQTNQPPNINKKPILKNTMGRRTRWKSEQFTSPMKPKTQFTRFTKPQNNTRFAHPLLLVIYKKCSSLTSMNPLPCIVAPSGFGYSSPCSGATHIDFEESLF